MPCKNIYIYFKGPIMFIAQTISHLNCFSAHMNWMRASSLGSLHLRSTVEQSTTSGCRNSPLASLYSQSSGAGYGSMFSRISSMEPCCLIKSMALLGLIPLIVPQ
uniref:Uncharacterized protein n=1 Tax=Oncorhynchus tshawytscha TaxID=74940 RepID=A0AAZ3R4Q6_ONCTS